MSLAILAACNSTTVSKQAEENNSTKNNASKKDDSSPDNDKREHSKADEKKAEEPPAMPFKAIKPPKGATPLDEKYSAEEKKQMPLAEAHSGDPARTVPLGQTLLEGKQDLTDGPLKNNRLIAFYGTPMSESMGILGEYPPQEMMKKLKEQAAAYLKLDPEHLAIPTIELIATVAQRTPGPEGLYISGAIKRGN